MRQLLNLTVVRSESKAARLSEIYGGKWVYDCRATWWCDDEKRSVSRCKSCMCDDDCNHLPTYYLYGDGVPKIVSFG